jgi:hypothetical protein
MYDRFGEPIDAINAITGERLLKDVSGHKSIKGEL